MTPLLWTEVWKESVLRLHVCLPVHAIGMVLLHRTELLTEHLGT